MTDFVKVCNTEEIMAGTMKKVIAGGREILLTKVGNRYYCADNHCPHLSGDLSQGTLVGTIVTCPLHHSQFDLTDGHAVRWTDLTGIKLTLAKTLKPPKPLKIYPVKVEGDNVLVGI